VITRFGFIGVYLRSSAANKVFITLLFAIKTIFNYYFAK